VYCLNASDGNLIWSYLPDHYIQSSPAVFDGKVYIGTNGGTIYCLDKITGELLWSNRTNGSIRNSSPAVADGNVYIGAKNEFYCFDAYTGDMIWNYPVSTGSSPAVADGKVYIGSNDCKVYCFGSLNPAPITGPSWGFINVNYIFCIVATNPNANTLYCKWDWDDGNSTDWLGPYSSGEMIYGSHAWTQRGTYGVRVKLKDISGQESGWSDAHVIRIYELKKALIFGRVANGTSNGEFTTLYTIHLRAVLFHPFQLLYYGSGEKITFSENNIYLVISSRFIIGLVKAVI
jgi:outer membrane protein assembly factor BamB